MAKKPKAKAEFPPVPRARDSGPRLDLLLPRDWPQSDAPIIWRARPRIGETTSGRGSVEDLPGVGSAPVYVWTPATETLLTQTILPTKSRAKVAQALPFALEDQLLDDPTHLHFAWRREHDDTICVAVTARERIRAWLSGLQRARLNATALCPATLLIPWSPGCWSAAFHGNELMVRTGPVSGFTCAVANDKPAPLLVTNLKDGQQGSRAPEYLIVFQPPADFKADVWSSVLGVPVRVESGNFFDVPGDSSPALNLLQGEFAVESDIGRHLRPWLPAAAMLGLWMLGAMVFNVVEWWQLHQRHEQTTREMAALVQSTFPDIKNPDYEPMKQMQAHLERLQARSGTRPFDMLPLLSRTAPAWQADPRLRMRGIRYNDRSLTVDVTAPDNQALDRILQALRSNGLQAETLTTTSRTNELDVRLRIKPLTTVSVAKP